MLPLVLDIEADPYVGSEKNGNQCYGLTPSAMVTWIQTVPEGSQGQDR